MKRKHEGLAPYRLKDNPEERRIAQAWQKHNDDGNTLAWLLDPERGCAHSPPDPSDRDIVVAATVMQWLGSPVGQVFLRALGYERAKR